MNFINPDLIIILRKLNIRTRNTQDIELSYGYIDVPQFGTKGFFRSLNTLDFFFGKHLIIFIIISGKQEF